MRKRLGVSAALALSAVVAGGAVFAAMGLLRPLPSPAFRAAARTQWVFPGVPPRPAWPAGAEAVVGATGAGILATHGGAARRPIASLAKIMTAYVILRDHPLRLGQPGPRLTVSAADVAAYRREQRQGQSVVKVSAGETLTQWQALAALLIPSGNNIADLLAIWDAGSVPAFVSRMNGQARSLGLRGTHYADASGFDPATVSTAADQYRLAARALQIPVFRQIVALPEARLPAAGLAYNVNFSLGHSGIDGVKTGSTPAAGGCLVFSSATTVGREPVTVIGAVLGVRPSRAEPSELDGVITASEKLLDSVRGSLERVDLLRAGTVLGQVRAAWGARTAAVAASGVTAIGWPGARARVTVTALPLRDSIRPGQPIARATVTAGGSVSHILLNASQRMPAPSLSWRILPP